MAKSASKNRSELEFLKGELRRLKKQLNRIKKGEHVVIRQEDTEDSISYVVEDEGDCPSCGKGILVHVDLKYVLISSCPLCEHTERKRPDGKKTT